VVVLWGAGLQDLEPALTLHELDGVTVISGPTLGAWRASLRSDVLDRQAIDAAWQALDSHLRRRERASPGVDKVPTSALELILRCCATGLAALAGFLAAGFALRVVPWTWLWAIAAAGLLLAALPVRRYERAWLPALGWMAGVGSAMLLVAADMLKLLPN
jgi:hypothetical protein